MSELPSTDDESQYEDECVWRLEDPTNEFFFYTECGEHGVNKEDDYRFCPYCGAPLHVH